MFAGKITVVTGASGAIGSACAKRFKAAGATVVGMDMTAGIVEGIDWLQVDLTSEPAIVAAFAETSARYAGIDVLVQCAAVLKRSAFLETTARDIDLLYAVNARAVILCAREAANMMVRTGRKGVIVNLGSLAAEASDAVSIGYDASKGAVRAATGGMAVALAKEGIRVVEVAPGPMATPQGMASRRVDELDGYNRRRLPLGRWGVPDDVARAVLFAASDDAAYITGTTLRVDGGASASF